MGVCIGGRTVVEGLRDRRGNPRTSNVEVGGVGEGAHDIASSLRAINVGGQQDDGGLVRGNLGERHSHLGGGALDPRGRTKGTLRGVIILAETLGGGRVGHQVGMVLRVVVDDIAVEVPVGARGHLVDD